MTEQPVLCQKCSNPVSKTHQDDIGTTFYNCPSCGSVTKIRSVTAQQEKIITIEKPWHLEHINNIENPQLTGKPVTLDAIISSTSISHLVPSKINAVLREEGQDIVDIAPEIAIDDPINLSMVNVTQESQSIRLTKFLKQKYSPNDKVSITGYRSYRTVYMARVRPPVFSLEKQDDKISDEKGYEYKHLDIYAASDTSLNFQPSTLVRLTGLPLPHPKTQKTTILAYNVEFPEDNLNYDLEKVNQLAQLFEGKRVLERLRWFLDNFELYSRIFNRRNITTVALLVYFTPLYVQFTGACQRGWGIGVVVGDTTTGKSETVKKMSKLLRAGSVISAETASTVGLTGAATQTDRDGWFIEWGFLPLMDRKLLAIDGSHKLSASCWAALAEAERSGILSIAKAAKNTTYARARQIRIYNAVDREVGRYNTKSLGSFLYPVQALSTVLDMTSIARLDVAVFSDQRDVSSEDINKPVTCKHDSLLENMAEVLKWAWSNRAKVVWSDFAEAWLLVKADELHKKFYYEAVPLVAIDVKYKIARLSVALAYCTLSTNADFSVVTVTEEHVDAVINFLIDEYTHAGLGVLAQEHKHEKLTLDDAEQIFSILQSQVNISNLSEILHFIVTENRVTKQTLTQKFQLTDKTELRPLIAALQTVGLIKSGKGFYSTPKLIEAYKLTKGFTTLATLTTFKNKPSTSNKTNSEPPIPAFENTPQKILTVHSETNKTNVASETNSAEINNRKQFIEYDKISSTEKCPGCTCYAVEYIIKMPTNETRRFCAVCFDKLKKTFSTVLFIPKYRDVT